jgi:signal transduction histidine kinase
MTPDTTSATFLLRLVHELRTPLGSLRMLHELLGSRAACREDERAAGYLAKMREAVNDLQDLLEQVEGLGRALQAEAGDSDESIPLPELLRRLEERLDHRDLQVDHGHGLPETFQGDRRWLGEILEPVVEGALLAGGEGGVVVEAHPPGATGEVCITVRDAGPPPAELEGFFEPFAHTDPRARRQRGGRSLKLSTAERRAVGLGGRLTVAKDPRGGAIFTLHLPVTAD